MVWLVISSDFDEAAHWAAFLLPSAGQEQVELVTSADLVGAIWDHRLTVDCDYTQITLTDGRVINSREIQGTLNRLQQAPLPVLAVEDREYGFNEMSALVMSWLASLPGPILNSPDTRGLAGAWRRPAEWAMLAAKAGLPAAPVFIESDFAAPVERDAWIAWPPHAPIAEDVIVVGEAVFAIEALDEPTVDACRRLACISQTPVLGLAFSCATCGGLPELIGATPLPDLRAGGQELVEALAGALKEERAGR